VRLKSFTGTPEAIAAYGAVGSATLTGGGDKDAAAGEDFIAVLDGVTTATLPGAQGMSPACGA
jgi:hypothetical protein